MVGMEFIGIGFIGFIVFTGADLMVCMGICIGRDMGTAGGGVSCTTDGAACMVYVVTGGWGRDWDWDCTWG